MEQLHQGDILIIEKIKHPVLVVRGGKRIDRLTLPEMMNVSDAIQSIFKYS